MEHDPHGTSRPSEGLAPPLGIAEAGSNISEKSDSTKDKKNKKKKDALVLGSTAVTPGLSKELAGRAETLTNFQKLLRGDPSARAAVLGLPGAVEVKKTDEHGEIQPVSAAVVKVKTADDTAPGAETQQGTGQAGEAASQLDGKDSIDGAREPGETDRVKLATEESADRTDKPVESDSPLADVISLEEYRQAKQAKSSKENQPPIYGDAYSQAEYNVAVGDDAPPPTPPPATFWLGHQGAQRGDRVPGTPGMHQGSGGESGGSDEPVYPNFGSGLGGPAGYGAAPEMPSSAAYGPAERFAASDTEPTGRYRDNDPAGRPGAASAEQMADTLPLPAIPHVTPELADRPDPNRPESSNGFVPAAAAIGLNSMDRKPAVPHIPTGFERTPADVSRAAWRGLVIGWFIGRHGKNKAIKRAVSAVQQRQQPKASGAQVPGKPHGVSMRPLEATPPYGSAAAASAPAAYERTSPNASPPPFRETFRPEAAEQSAGVAPQQPAERVATTLQLSEALAAPAAAALSSAGERRGGRAIVEAPAADAVLGARSERAIGKAELKQLAKAIRVDGVSLQEIYNSKQIDDEGLRAVIDMHLRGGDIQKQLTQEIIEKQKMFERDPFNRKRSHGQVRKAISNASEKIAETSASLAKTSQQAAAKAGKSIASGTQKAQAKVAEGTETQLWSGIAAIVIIYAIILALLLV